MIENKRIEITLQLLSTEASTRLAQSYLPNNAQPSVMVPTTRTSLFNKGKSRQASSLSEESSLENGPHSKKSLDTAKSSESEPSTSDLKSYPPNEMPSSSLPPIYSEAVNNGAISVNSGDDTEDYSGSDSNMTPEEVEAVYDLWRQMPEQPEELSPWASTASLLDKLRGVITRQKL